MANYQTSILVFSGCLVALAWAVYFLRRGARIFSDKEVIFRNAMKCLAWREIQTVKEGSEVIGFDQDMGTAMTGAKLRRWNIDPVRTINPVLQSRRMSHLHRQMRERFETRAPQAIILGTPY